MPLLLIAFIVLISFAAVMPSKRDEIAADRLDQGKVAAGQLRSWHAAAVRACYAFPATPGGTCSPGRIQDGNVRSQMSGLFRTQDFPVDRFGSYFDGSYVYSAYTGRGASRPKEALADASAALIAISPPDSRGNVGYWNQASGAFVPGGYTSKFISNNQAREVSNYPCPSQTQPGSYIAGVLTGSPMVGTRISFAGGGTGTCRL